MTRLLPPRTGASVPAGRVPVTRRPSTVPLLTLTAMLLAFAVMAMHQLGTGHLPTGSVMGSHLTAAEIDNLTPSEMTSRELPPKNQPAASAIDDGCAAGCRVDGDPGRGSGHDITMVCLAVLPVLLVLLFLLVLLGSRRAGLAARWAAGLGSRPPSAVPAVTGAGPGPPLLLTLCVSRT